jgi:hypothetical protein
MSLIYFLNSLIDLKAKYLGSKILILWYLLVIIYNNPVALSSYIRVCSIFIVILTYKIACEGKSLEVIFCASLVLI